MTVNMSPKMINCLDGLVEAGLTPSRSAAIRAAIRDVILLDDDTIADVMDAADRSPFRKTITSINMPAPYIAAIHAIVHRGIAENRSDFIRVACARFIETEAKLLKRIAVDVTMPAAAHRMPPKLDMRSCRAGWKK